MMLKNILTTVIAATISVAGFAQKNDGTTKSLVNTEKEFAASVAKHGTKSAYNTYAAADALAFTPNPVNAREYYSKAEDIKTLSWTPAYARVSKSADWGFTTGAYEHSGAEKTYGDYLSIWKMVNGKWQLALDLATTHNKPLNKVAAKFPEPKEFHKPQYTNEKDLVTGRGIILTTEQTLQTTLKSYGIAAFSGFISDDVRLLFPGREPIIGKAEVMAFYNSMVSKISYKTTKADKAMGGDLAYTYGVATIDYKADLRESFHYVNIYERQPDHNWNLILQIYTPAER
jgi:hypothetical protein